VRVTLAAFLDAVVVVDPVQYQGRGTGLRRTDVTRPSGYLIRSDTHAPRYLSTSLLTCRWNSSDPKLLSDRVSHFKVQIPDCKSLLIDNVFMLLQ
jgi:hypothetical protein